MGSLAWTFSLLDLLSGSRQRVDDGLIQSLRRFATVEIKELCLRLDVRRVLEVEIVGGLLIPRRSEREDEEIYARSALQSTTVLKSKSAVASGGMPSLIPSGDSAYVW